MLDIKIIEKVRSTYQKLAKVTLPEQGDGWVNLANLGSALIKEGFNYREKFKLNDLIIETNIFSFHTEESGKTPVKYIREKIEKVSDGKNLNHVQQRTVSEDADKIRHRLRLDNNQFIGQFAPQKNGGVYKITDIRNTDFIKIEDKERGIKNKDLSISFKSYNKDFNRFAYYKFTWELLEKEPLKFGIDLREEITPVYPKDIVRRLYEGTMHISASSAKKISSSLDTLKKQLTQSGKEVFIYELLQNANDYPRHVKMGGENKVIPVEVEFYITAKYLIFQHTGEYFNPKNIAAICDINDGEKLDNSEAIGYKGIGFKTVFLDNDYVLLNTGDYTFRFDKSATDVINTPWQILPIWTESNEYDNIIASIFRQHPNDEFRVKFALQPRESGILTDASREDNYIDLFSKVFDSERVILFIPNIKKVSVFVDGQKEPIVREKLNKEWCLSDPFVDDIPEEITDKINNVLDNPDSLRSDGYEKIPEKYLNFRKTAVKFACKKDGRKLKPVEDATLYCYLPAKRADWGFNFLMNTDMVPNGQRDDIEDIELNHVIARIAGKQFFYWIKQLIESEEYELDSIFELIPDFEECKKSHVYKTFIEEFQEEFEKLLNIEPIIPVMSDDKYTLIPITKTIYDTTAISCSSVMPDKDLLDFVNGHGDWNSNPDEYFAHPDVRGKKYFYSFLSAYKADNMEFRKRTILSLCENEAFNTWLSIEDNNNRFLNFLLENNHLFDFIKENKKIFLGNDDKLYASYEIYENIDNVKKDIPMFDKYIPHLSYNTRQFFAKNEDWETTTKNQFKELDITEMITNYILLNQDAMNLLNEASNSVAFYRYLCENQVDLEDYRTKIPYITEDGECSTDYENNRFFFDQSVYHLTEETWLGENVIKVLSHIYFDNIEEKEIEKLKVLFKKNGFAEFDRKSFVSEIVIGDDFGSKVNVVIEKDYDANKAFVDYVFASESELKENSLKNYVLRCVDIKGNDIYLCSDDIRYFNQEAYAQNSSYADNINHTWLKDNMMYALSNAYFEGYEKDTARKMESFLRQQFGIKTFTDKSFFTDVVIKNKAIIYESIVDETTMLTFLDYIKRDAERLFDGSMSFNDIKDMPLLAHDGSIVKDRETNIQFLEYDDAAKSLCGKVWCPKSFIVLSQVYSSDFSQDMRQLFKISKFDSNVVIDLITQHKTFQDLVKVPESNIDFWRWVKENQKHLTVDKLEVPLFDKNNNITLPSSLYISDIYQQDHIESLVTRYVKDAKFVSSSYIEIINESEQREWVKLFKKVGLKSDNKDILFSDILPNIASFEHDTLDMVITMMTKHLKDLKDNWDERKTQITQLKVRTRSGEYKTLDKITIVNVDENSVLEPFKYITLSNEIHPEIFQANKELLLLISKEFENSTLITSKQKWIEAKVKEYIEKFSSDENSVSEDNHIIFVRELAKLLNEYEIDDSLRSQIKYRVKSTEAIYKYAHELTLGSAYSPICDFEANGVSDLLYLSDDYIFEGNKDIIKSFFKSKAEGIHSNMTKGDLKFLSNRNFAFYFWTNCFSRRLSEYKTWIEEGCFENLVCIPTENSVQKPELLYAPRLVASYAVRAKLPKWEDKVPCKAIVDSISSREARELFEKLQFCTALSFEDCLYYLAWGGDRREDESENRHMIIKWMLAAPTYNEKLIDNYRNSQNSTWRNGKSQRKHISELFAIHPNAITERNIFWGNEFVLQTCCFPPETELFEKICEILKIQCLTNKDFVATPIGEKEETEKMMAVLRPRLLILAAIENPDIFQQLFEMYNEKISHYHFLVCEKIDLGYETIHNDVMRIYNDDTHLYYVGSWTHNRTFLMFCESIRRIIECYVDKVVCEDVLDTTNTVETCIEKYCSSVVYNDEFRALLKSMDLAIKVEQEDELSNVETDYYSDFTDDHIESTTQENDEKTVENTQFGDKLTTNDTYKAAIEQSNTAAVQKDTVEKSTQISPEIDQTNSLRSTLQPQSTISSSIVNQSDENTDDELDRYDTYLQVDDEEIECNDLGKDDQEDNMPAKTQFSNSSQTPIRTTHRDYDPDYNGLMGSVDMDKDYQPMGDKPYKPHTRKHPKNYTKEEVERLRTHGAPLELESLPPTKEEIDLLAQCNIAPEQIADTNYLAQLRLYLNLTQEQNEEPEETMEEFVHNANDVTVHKLKGYGDDGRYIHTCSAARGVMYTSPTVWNRMVDDKWKICVYLDGQGKNFHYIENAEEFLKLVEKDDVVIKITGKEKLDVVKALYSGLLEDTKGTAYTLIRVAARTNMDAVFAHYVGAMAEEEDGNEDLKDY